MWSGNLNIDCHSTFLPKFVSMKSFILVATMSLLGYLSHGQSLSKGVVFDKSVYDFGRIREADGKISHTFTFENKASKPVIITSVNSSCGCISNNYTKTPVKPNGKGEVEVVFSPQYKSGFFSSEVEVMLNGGTEYANVWIKGEIIPLQRPIEDEYPYNFGDGFYLALDVATFTVKAGETKSCEIFYANDTNNQMVVRFDPAKSNIKVGKPLTIPPKGKGSVIFDYTRPFVQQDVKYSLPFMVSVYINDRKSDIYLKAIIFNVNK